jgi:hypothetical protein
MASNVGHAPTPDAAGPVSGWWKAYVETVPDGYLDLLAAEEDATRIVHFHPTFIPGLLQTESYAAAITPATTAKSMTAAEAENLVRVRMLRQQAALDGSPPKELVFLLDETALRRPVGSPIVMREQLDHLLVLADHPAVTLVVVPFQEQPHPGLLGAFILLQYASGPEDVLCFEWQMGNILVRNEPALVRRYHSLADQLMSAGRSGRAAKQLISAARADIR